MMADPTQAPSAFLLGGIMALAGSLATMVVGKILDSAQRRKDHSYALQKEFFEKKLKAAEAVIGSCYAMASLLSYFDVLIQKLPQHAGTPFLSDFVKSLSTQAQKINNEISLVQVSSAALYFDTAKLEILGKAFGEQFVTAMLMLGRISKSVETGDEATKEKMKGEVTKSLQDISLSLQHLKTGMDSFIKEVRSEMKKNELK